MTVIDAHLQVSICLSDSYMAAMSKRLRLMLWPYQPAADPGCLSSCVLPALAALQGKDTGLSEDLALSKGLVLQDNLGVIRLWFPHQPLTGVHSSEAPVPVLPGLCLSQALPSKSVVTPEPCFLEDPISIQKKGQQAGHSLAEENTALLGGRKSLTQGGGPVVGGFTLA